MESIISIMAGHQKRSSFHTEASNQPSIMSQSSSSWHPGELWPVQRNEQSWPFYVLNEQSMWKTRLQDCQVDHIRQSAGVTPSDCVNMLPKCLDSKWSTQSMCQKCLGSIWDRITATTSRGALDPVWPHPSICANWKTSCPNWALRAMLCRLCSALVLKSTLERICLNSLPCKFTTNPV